jgi:hypothetical protein
MSGTVYLCLRPAGDVAELYHEVQRSLASAAGTDRASWPAPHLSLKGFGTQQKPTDRRTETEILALVEGWARRTPALRLEVESLDSFEDERIPILRIRRTAELGDA